MANAFENKRNVARKTTYVSVAANILTATLQVGVGTLAHSQALIADGMHSLADLVADGMVLFANRHSNVQPDADHHYGHSRYETVASLFLGILLLAVAIGMLWRAGERILYWGHTPPMHSIALWVAIATLILKEGLFRYMLRAAKRIGSAMLIANAWHARSDAASSLVVAIGIMGSLLGVRWLDPVAAGLVGLMVGKMGFSFTWDALQDLSDRALDEDATERMRSLLLATPGVRDVHGLRTRKMGDMALVDAHILVDPTLSVSEGHYIAERARKEILKEARVLDALIHVDPEDDAPLTSLEAESAQEQSTPGRFDVYDTEYSEERAQLEAAFPSTTTPHCPLTHLPTREVLEECVQRALMPYGLAFESITIHYLHEQIDLDIYLPQNWCIKPTVEDTFPEGKNEAAVPRAVPTAQKLAQQLQVRRVRLFCAVTL